MKSYFLEGQQLVELLFAPVSLKFWSADYSRVMDTSHIDLYPFISNLINLTEIIFSHTYDIHFMYIIFIYIIVID